MRISSWLWVCVVLCGCGGPRSERPLVVRLGHVTSPEDGSVHVVFGLGGAAGSVSAAPGTLEVVIRERPAMGVNAGSGDVVCSGRVPVPIEAFDESDQWRASVTVPLDTPCPPPPTTDDRVRELAAVFTPDGRSALGAAYADPPASMRGPNTIARSYEIMANREIYSPRTTGPEIERVRAYAASVAALAPLVVAAPLVPCDPIPRGSVATLIDHQDLEVIASRLEGRMAEPRVRDRLTYRSVIGIVTLLGERGTDAAVATTANWVATAPDLVWIRRRTGRTEGSLRAADHFEPGTWTGTLHLARRSDAQVLCGIAIEATSGAEVSALALRGSEVAALSRALEDDLDLRAEAAVEVSRGRLLAGVTFERPPEPPR